MSSCSFLHHYRPNKSKLMLEHIGYSMSYYNINNKNKMTINLEHLPMIDSRHQGNHLLQLSKDESTRHTLKVFLLVNEICYSIIENCWFVNMWPMTRIFKEYQSAIFHLYERFNKFYRDYTIFFS